MRQGIKIQTNAFESVGETCVATDGQFPHHCGHAAGGISGGHWRHLTQRLGVVAERFLTPSNVAARSVELYGAIEWVGLE